MSEKNQHMIKGALILSIAALISKVLSAIYRVPFQNMVGDVGFYVYQQVYPIYGIGMILTLNGLPTFIAKLLAEESNEAMRKLIRRRVFYVLILLGILLFAMCWYAAPLLADWMADSRLTRVIRQVAWLFLLLPILATLRGYFQQKMNMTPVAISQVGEQLIRVSVILGVAYFYTSNQVANVYQIGSQAMSGAWLGGLFASTILLIWYYNTKSSTRNVSDTSIVMPKKYRYSKLLKRILIEGGWLCLFAALLLIFQLLDSFTVKKGLVLAGFAENAAKGMKGVYDRGQPLVQLGMVVATAFSATFLPMLSQHYSVRDEQAFLSKARLFAKVTVVFAAAATAGLVTIMPAVNVLLFEDQQGVLALRIFVCMILLASLINVYSSLYQSQNQFRIPGVAFLIGIFVKAASTLLLVKYFGIVGAALSSLIGLSCILIVCILGNKQRLWTRQQLIKFCSKLLIVCIVMASFVWLSQYFLQFSGSTLHRGGAFINCLVGISVGVLLFIIMSYLLKLFTVKEWRQISRIKSKGE